MQVSRRALIAGGAAAAVAPALPSPAFAATAPLAPVIPTLPAFAVGIAGEHNWKVFFAATAERAKELWLWEYGDHHATDPDFRAENVPHLSGISTEEGDHYASVSDCIIMGWDHNCDRCHCDVSCDGDNYQDIGGGCVCQECLTPQEQDAADHEDFLNAVLNEDHDLTDPAIFALLRPEDFFDDTMLEVLAEEAALHPECAHLSIFLKAADQGLPNG